ncbi:MAG TPA: hypothetical protein VGH82_01915 [Gaiellaceae bacterium]
MGLVLLVFPQLRPLGHQPTPNRSASITGMVVNHHTTRSQFLDYSDQSKLGFTKSQLAVMGASTFARIQITGYRGKHLMIERQVVNARTGNVIGEARDFTVTPTADTNTHRWWDWVPLRAGRGSYLMVIKVIDPSEHAAVACGQTAAFGGLQGLLPSTTPPQLCEGEGS